jgi:cation diffusion facilitator family transporter
MARRPSSKFVVYAALLGNLLVALVKFVAAAWTGSSAMLSEAVHSVVDTGDQAVLLYGMHRAAKPPDENHPLGYGRELYFWSFIVALLIFTIGAGVTLYEGIHHIRDPHPIENPTISYVVLGLSMVFEGTTWFIAWREFSKTTGDLRIYEAVRQSKDPPVFIVLFEDTAALIGLLIALAGTFAAQYFDAPIIDGIASIGISILLAGVAFLLARESKGLLIGEPASWRIRDCILAATAPIAGLEHASLMFTVHLSPDQIVAALSVDFKDTLTAPEIKQKVAELERAIRAKNPDVVAVFIKPQPLVPATAPNPPRPVAPASGM